MTSNASTISNPDVIVLGLSDNYRISNDFESLSATSQKELKKQLEISKFNGKEDEIRM